jgi:uncharacterized protein YjlB
MMIQEEAMANDPQTFQFDDDGETPNNPRLPLVLYRGAIDVKAAGDPAAAFEKIFARHGWGDGWRNGIHDFLHFHTRTHEVLGVARGRAKVEFGGAKGCAVELQAGDVAILPAGIGHRRLSCSTDLLVVGAYPANGAIDETRPGKVSHDKAVADVAKTPLPQQDPVFGANGPLKTLWKI